MRTAVFITPETLLNPKDAPDTSNGKPCVFGLAEQAVDAISRLKHAGFVVIGVGREDMFHGFASKTSCDQFLSASCLDDLIIPPLTDRFSGVMIQAAAKWLVDLDQSYWIGLSERETREAQLTGCTPLQLEDRPSGIGGRFDCLSQAVDRVLAWADESEPATMVG